MTIAHPNTAQRPGDPRAAAPRQAERLMTPGQVAALFNVNPKTVTRWAGAGLLGSVRTPGGHRRFRASEVFALLNQNTTQ
ncbi:DNA binding domain protein, excisionase family OS=Tsukamurella paurometabola (strain ATCC 8368 / DSM / CCUG 35730 / CIP 100753 / JCM 10117 / KCTC 9821 /NBRC 16120 / NCIMB 702349 / NCTC 13040) OX=521096 GN=Tpau_0693 PE=4 SV=1 [Tsukamurella paurometabola]|uniref:DNA binding domain protein, excisionase family n=2 Tax=Tsukamurella TaxID=2060 RepID=D5UT43_TSUPD|nr:DNA binding domain protein, excisionase family [Tsukamurella paurometabola DSM 20162]SUP43510.1 DNA binding domain, excisionase family [Tsukamurella paurometabola]